MRALASMDSDLDGEGRVLAVEEDGTAFEIDCIREPIAKSNARDEFEAKLSGRAIRARVPVVDPGRCSVDDFDSIGGSKLPVERRGRWIEGLQPLNDAFGHLF